jgi:hypothetical protein
MNGFIYEIADEYGFEVETDNDGQFVLYTGVYVDSSKPTEDEAWERETTREETIIDERFCSTSEENEWAERFEPYEMDLLEAEATTLVHAGESIFEDARTYDPLWGVLSGPLKLSEVVPAIENWDNDCHCRGCEKGIRTHE